MMEEVKENTYSGIEKQVDQSVKIKIDVLPTVMPRQPLMDLKQIMRHTATDSVDTSSLTTQTSPESTPKYGSTPRKVSSSSLMSVKSNTVGDKTELKEQSLLENRTELDICVENQVKQFPSKVTKPDVFLNSQMGEQSDRNLPVQNSSPVNANQSESDCREVRSKEATSSVASWVLPLEEQLHWQYSCETSTDSVSSSLMFQNKMVGGNLGLEDEVCFPLLQNDLVNKDTEKTVGNVYVAKQAITSETIQSSEFCLDSAVENFSLQEFFDNSLTDLKSKSNHSFKNSNVHSFRAKLDSPEFEGDATFNNKHIFGSTDLEIVTEYKNVTESDMKLANYSSVLCENHDVSIHNATQMSAQNCPTADSFSSICEPAYDFAIQNNVEIQSILCSPLVPGCSHGNYVLVSSPTLVDVGISTEERILVDVAVEAHPDTQENFTDVDQALMVSSATNMTPLKVDKKHGKKLTAEDIRKLHPRILANELETLKMENAKLESQLQSMEKDRKKLVSQEDLMQRLDKTKTTLEQQKQIYIRDVEALQNKCEQLETDIVTMKLKQENEVAKVREEYETNNYRDHFYSSQKLVRELKDDLEQYSKLGNDVELAKKLQRELDQAISVNLMAMKETAGWLKNQKEKLQSKESDLVHLCDKYEAGQKLLQEQQSILVHDREQMVNIVSTCKENMIQLDAQLQETLAELNTYKEMSVSLEEQLTESNTVNANLQLALVKVEREKDDIQNEKDKLIEDLKVEQAQLNDQYQQLKEAQSSLTQANENLQQQIAIRNEAFEKKSLEVTNLERTLDSREYDIDVLERDLFECREIIYNQMETIKTQETSKNITQQQLVALTSENSTLKECLAKLRAKEQQLSCTLESTQEELAGVRENAARVMKQQGAEIADCSASIGEFVDHMTTVLVDLKRKSGLTEDVSINENVKEKSTQQIALPTQKTTTETHISLVTQVLNAIKSLGCDSMENDWYIQSLDTADTIQATSDGTRVGPCKVASAPSCVEVVDSTVSQIKYGHSEKSVHASIMSNKQLTQDIHSSTMSELQQDACLSVDNQTIGDGVKEKLKHKSISPMEMSLRTVSPSSEEFGTTYQMRCVADVFNQIMRVTHIMEKALKSSLRDVTYENEDLKSRLNQSDYSEKRLKARLEVMQGDLNKSQATVAQFKERLETMSDRLEIMIDQDAELKNHQLKIQELHGKLQSMKTEKDLLSEQITELLAKLESLSKKGGQQQPGFDVNMQREIHALQRKVEKYGTLLLQKDDQIEEISCKAARRIKKLEDNWKKADAEVCRFDELIDAIKTVLVKSKIAQTDAKVRHLINFIDGKVDESAFKTDFNE